MSAAETALWWARVRAEGPLRMRSEVGTPPGMLRLVEHSGEHHWLLPSPPDGVTPAVLRELRVQMLPGQFPHETSRVLTAALRCCWSDSQASPWPGRAATIREVLDVVGLLAPGRSDEVLHRFGTAALRRLHVGGWLVIDEAALQVRLGPRVATWPGQDLPALRELCRELPLPRSGQETDRE